MSRTYPVVNGELYSNGVTKEMKIASMTGTDIRLKGSGTGSYKLIGKLTANGDWKQLGVVRLKDFAVVDTITDSEIYAADVAGMYSVKVADVVGFDNIWAEVLA